MKLTEKLLEKVPGVDRIFAAVNPANVPLHFRIAAWIVVALALALIFWALT